MKKLFFLLSPLLAACTGNSDKVADTPKVQVGMSRQQVENLMGLPESRTTWAFNFDSAGIKGLKPMEGYHYSKDTVIFIDMLTDTVGIIKTNYSKDSIVTYP